MCYKDWELIIIKSHIAGGAVRMSARWNYKWGPIASQPGNEEGL